MPLTIPQKIDSIGLKGSTGCWKTLDNLTVMNNPTMAKQMKSWSGTKVRAMAAKKHNFVATEGFTISWLDGCQSPRTNRTIGPANPDPFPRKI